MISEEYTYKVFGYYAWKLLPKSQKRIVVICPDCYEYTTLTMADYTDERRCGSCAAKNRKINWNRMEKMWTVWGKGSHHTEETIQSISNSHKGKKFTQEHKDNISKNHKGMSGLQHKQKTKDKIGDAHRGKIVTEETKERNRQARLLQVFPIKDTTIEVEMQNILIENNYEFLTHKAIGKYQPDIIFPEKRIIIECDGDYWHNYPDGREKDRLRDKDLLDNYDFIVIRFWEHEIHEDIEGCLNKFEKEYKTRQIKTLDTWF